MENNILISVIVPIYGVELYIDQTISSICNQTYANLEIILVDDGSKDNCGQICDIWGEKDNRIRVIHKKNGGLVSARKAGLSIANGLYVSYVDGDDWIKKDFYESIMCEVSKLEKFPDIVSFGFTRFYPDGTESINNNDIEIGLYKDDNYTKLLSNIINKTPFYTMSLYPTVWSKLFLREKLVQYQNAVDDAISIGEDFVVTFPYLLSCSNFFQITNNDYMYRLNKKGMTGSRDSNYLKKVVPLIEWIYKYMYLDNSPYKSQLEQYALHVVINGINILMDSRTRIAFHTKCKILNDVLSVSEIRELIRVADKTTIGKRFKKIILTAVNKNYLRCFINVHLYLIENKIYS